MRSACLDQEQFRLLDLPAELRNQICELALADNKVYIYVADPGSRRLGFRNRDYYTPYEDPLVLTRICRQLHAETAQLALRSIIWVGTMPCLLAFFRDASNARLAQVGFVYIQLARMASDGNALAISGKGMKRPDGESGLPAITFAKMTGLKHLKVLCPSTLQGHNLERMTHLFEERLGLSAQVRLEVTADDEW